MRNLNYKNVELNYEMNELKSYCEYRKIFVKRRNINILKEIESEISGEAT